MSKKSRSSLGSNPLICWSVLHWVSTPRGMQYPQRKKTAGTCRPLEHGLKFTILTNNQDATFADVAALLKEQMAKIGVEAKITLLDATAFVDRVLVKHDFAMAVNSFGT